MTNAPASWVGLDLEQGRYYVAAALGEGGMAYIYRAYDRKKNRDVVLKVPKPALLADSEFVHRFAREVKTLVELRHPAIVSVLGFGRHLGQPFVVLEYMPGGTLDERSKPCQHNELDVWLGDIAAALDHLHAHGYVHRDVKPSNILFGEDGRARLSDFGVIKSIDEKAGQTRALTESGVAVGTPEYMAPELARGETFDGKIDQYALAVTVYEMLAGRRPIDGGTGPVILVKQIQEAPIALNELDATIPVPLAAAIGRALAKQPSQRFNTCSEFAQVVSSAIDDRPLRGVTPGIRNDFATTRRSNPIWWLAPLLATLIVTGGTTAWLLTRPSNKAEQARVEADPPTPMARELFGMSVTAPRAYVGKPNHLVVRVDRKEKWSGPIEVKLENPLDGLFQETSATIPGEQSECRLEYRPRRPLTNVKVTVRATAQHAHPQSATVLLNAKATTFSIAAIDGLDLAPGDTRNVSVFLTRDGHDGAVELVVRGPRGVRIEPADVRFGPNENETTVKLTAVSPVVGPVRLMHNGMEKGRFDVRVVATAITPMNPAATEKTNNSIARSLLRETSAINVLAFHPLEASTLVVWNARGGVALWDLNSQTQTVTQQLSTPGLRCTISPDGRQVVSCGINLVHLMNSRGDTISQGPSNYRILGVYYDGQLPLFWTPNGVCNALGRLVQTNSPGRGVTKLKYATSGSSHSLRDLDGKVQFRHATIFHSWPVEGAIIDFALSHDGRWAAVAAGSKVWIQDTKRLDASPVWSQEMSDVTAIAIAPNGQRLAVGLNNGEIRLKTIELPK